MKTPILDKFGLHPFGGYCTCYSRPYDPCVTCNRAAAHRQRWDGLSAKNKKLATAELDAVHRTTSNQDGR